MEVGIDFSKDAMSDGGLIERIFNPLLIDDEVIVIFSGVQFENNFPESGLFFFEWEGMDIPLIEVTNEVYIFSFKAFKDKTVVGGFSFNGGGV